MKLKRKIKQKLQDFCGGLLKKSAAYISTMIVAGILMICAMSALLTGCTEAETATDQLVRDSDSFNIYRRLTVINLRTDNVLFEIEGYFSYKNETDGDLSVVVKTGKEEYKRFTIPKSCDGALALTQQLEIKDSNGEPYPFSYKIYANYPETKEETNNLGVSSSSGTVNVPKKELETTS